mmetsp:Transcript_22352/g.62197  ORF Transcript_22352/g.62197 Transcript_22352/m.62197 type:complete len:125 (+) Transcript_22352:654-1028(+)
MRGGTQRTTDSNAMQRLRNGTATQRTTRKHAPTVNDSDRSETKIAGGSTIPHHTTHVVHHEQQSSKSRVDGRSKKTWLSCGDDDDDGRWFPRFWVSPLLDQRWPFCHVLCLPRCDRGGRKNRWF